MTEEAMASVPAKADPETLVLRGKPGRVVRFRRGAVIGIAAVGSSAIIGVAWVALQPAGSKVAVSADDRPETHKPAPEALANAPRTYDDVPQLGPPLPGDLGRPFLAHQRSVVAAQEMPLADGAVQAGQQAEAERQRIASQRRGARESGVMIQIGSAPAIAGPQPVAPLPEPGPGAQAATLSAAHPDADPNRQQRKLDFIAQRDSEGDLNPHAVVAAASPYTLSAGSVIAASLITGLNSDLPGLVAAQVSENTYDSVTGRILLIPQGSRLIGSYDSVVAIGQSRALVIWQRIIFPDGASIRIDNFPATDTAGYAGLSDRIDRHGLQLLKGVALATLFGAGTELSFGSSESDLVRAVRESSQQSASRAGDQIVLKSLNIQPTLKVRPGWPLRVVVHKDIVLRPWISER